MKTVVRAFFAVLGLSVAVVATTLRASAADEKIVWREGTSLQLEGVGFKDAAPYCRLPERAVGKVPENVATMRRHATGLYIRFKTDAARVHFDWKVANEHPTDPLIPEAGLSGIDIYRFEKGVWTFVGNKRYWTKKKDEPGKAWIDTKADVGYLVYLPTRSEIEHFRLGVAEGFSLKPFPHADPSVKPIVHYGTSIVHGGCASRPGLTFTAIAGRALDIPYINLGFSGAAKMESSIPPFLAELDASLYLIDPVWNMNAAMIAERAAPFLRQLKAARPTTPILLCEGCSSVARPKPENVALRKVYEQLKAEDPQRWRNLYYFDSETMLPKDEGECTHDFCHPNDSGMRPMGDAYAKRIREVLENEKFLAARGNVPCPRNATLKTMDGPLIQAHRGSRCEYQDNAAGGFKWCLAKGLRGFETDVRFTKDHHLIIMHDGNANRTTDGVGTIEKLTFDEVRTFRLQSCSEIVPTPEEVMQALDRRDDVFIEIEMKAYPSAFYTPEVLEDYCRKLDAAARANLASGTYAFTSFNDVTLATMRRVNPQAPLGLIMGTLEDKHIALAKKLGCCSVAPTLNTSRAMLDKAHDAGLTICLWMVQNAAQWREARAKGADRATSDYPHLLDCAVRGKPKKLVAMDLDATLCQHRSPIPEKNLAALKELQKRFACVMMGAGNAPRIYKQMGNYPIDIVGNYGMQVATAADGKFRIVKAVTNQVDRAMFRRITDDLRARYGYTKFDGDSLEFHASGMVTFGLLGTSPAAEHKLAFDSNRRKRRAMYPEVCRLFPDYAVYIGGSTSFDFAGKQYNKYDATLAWAKDHGFDLDDVVFIGDDFFDGGGDSHVRIKGMDHIVITDYRNFANAVGVLLK